MLRASLLLPVVLLASSAAARPGTAGFPGSAGCLASVTCPESATWPDSMDRETRAALRELGQCLEDGPASARREALLELVRLDEPAAWELVVEALDDASPRVADTAQLLLGGIRDGGLLEGLLGREGLRSREPSRRLRVAELLGRVEGPVDGEALASALDHRDVRLSRLLLWTMERLLLAGRLEGDRRRLLRAAGELCHRRRDPLLRADALVVCSLLLPPADAAAELWEAVGDREPAVRMAALVGFGHLRDGELEGARAARRLLADPQPAVRRGALAHLENRGDRETMAALVERLPVETDPRVAERIVEVLRGWTGLKHRRDPRPWRDHLATLTDGWRPAAPPSAGEKASAGKTGSAGPAQSAAGAQGRTVVPLSELELRGESLSFLVDFSGSTWDTTALLEEGIEVSRKELLDRRIGELLGRLSAGMSFNLIPYTDEPHPWSDERRPAREREVREARRFFERCRERGKGNVVGAIELALAEPGLETLVILTDGVPTGGEHWDMGLLIELLLRDNRFRGTVFEVVLVDSPRHMLRHWERLAAESGGRCLEVELGRP